MTRTSRAASLVALALVLASARPAAADESIFVYRRVYRYATTLQQKYTSIATIGASEDEQAAPVLAEAIEDLLSIQANYSKPSDRELLARAVREALVRLGAWRYAAAAPTAWSVVEQVTEPLARAEAMMALGSMRAVEYAPKIATILRNLNMGPSSDPEGDGRLAYGAILALEKLRDPVGFAPVFFASEGWYTKRVRDAASRALPSIATDPTDPVLEIVRLESLDRKVKALTLELSSGAPRERKLSVVSAALAVSVEYVARDRLEQAKKTELRRLGLRGFAALEGDGGSLVPLFATIYREALDADDKVLAMQALGVDGSEAAAIALAEMLLELDAQQRSGVSDGRREQLAKAGIQYARMTGSSAVSTALVAVSTNDGWSNSVISLAKEALAALK
ncbi:MAG: hypothetical protein JXA15_04490 [Spirochaetales bacterium]|nr:hypothetical protein [Spirochaetales bacterium]